MDDTIRRVVTGTDAAGRPVIASDERVAPATVALMPGAGFLTLWGADRVPGVPNDGAIPAAPEWFPPAGGVRVQVITIPPASAHPPAGIDMAAALADAERKLPGLFAHMDPDHPGMHRTDTVDVVYVLSGRCVLELDGGESTTLSAGDVVVQNGLRHAWRVPFDEPCTVFSVSLGASRAG